MRPNNCAHQGMATDQFIMLTHAIKIIAYLIPYILIKEYNYLIAYIIFAGHKKIIDVADKTGNINVLW